MIVSQYLGHFHIHPFLVIYIYKDCPFLLGEKKKWGEKTERCWKAHNLVSSFVFPHAWFIFFFFLKWQSRDHPTQQEVRIKAKIDLHVIWVQQVQSFNQLLCHGKFSIVRTAGCWWCYLKRIKTKQSKTFGYQTSHMSPIT